MENLTKIYVGVDVSKSQLDVYIHPIAKAISFANSKEGIDEILKEICHYKVEQIVCESTGGYEDLMLKQLRQAGNKVWQVEPNRIKSFIRSKGKKVKTDAIDAYMIALFAAQEIQEHEHVEYGDKHSAIHDLVKRRKDLTKMIVEENLRLNHPSPSICSIDIENHIDFMEKQLKDIDLKIQQLITQDDNLNKKAKIIESVPGVGKATTAMLIAELPELGTISNKQAAALVGVAPYTQQSGQYKGKSTISGGRSEVRSALYMAALVASRHNPDLKKFYNRLCTEKKKPAKVGITAVMRKLVTILNSMLKNQTMWLCSS